MSSPDMIHVHGISWIKQKYCFISKQFEYHLTVVKMPLLGRLFNFNLNVTQRRKNRQHRVDLYNLHSSWSGHGRFLERQRLLIPQDHHPKHYSDTQLVTVMWWHAVSTSVVTSASKIRLWQSGVTDDEWWVWPPGAQGQRRGRGRGLDLKDKEADKHLSIWENGVSVLLMSELTVASNSTSTKHWFSGFFHFLASFWPP